MICSLNLVVTSLEPLTMQDDDLKRKWRTLTTQYQQYVTSQNDPRILLSQQQAENTTLQKIISDQRQTIVNLQFHLQATETELSTLRQQVAQYE